MISWICYLIWTYGWDLGGVESKLVFALMSTMEFAAEIVVFSVFVINYLLEHNRWGEMVMPFRMPQNQLQNQQPIENLNVAANISQLYSLLLLLEDNSNNEIMEELQKQNKEYLSKIIEQNELIIKQNEELLKRK